MGLVIFSKRALATAALEAGGTDAEASKTGVVEG